MSRKPRTKAVLLLSLCLTALWVLTAPLAHAQIVLEEQFVYEPLHVNIDGQDGGLGFAGPWVSTISHGRIYWIEEPGLEFPPLPVAGGCLTRYGSAGRAQAHRLLSPESQAALTADNTTIWFSCLFKVPNSPWKHTSFLFGTDPFTTGGTPILAALGYGFGFTIEAPDGVSPGTGSINALAFDESTTPMIIEGTYIPEPIDATSLIVGKINWKPNGTPDELFLFNVTDIATEPTEDTAFASMTDLDFDQSAFDTIAVWDSNNGVIDEIRFGHTFADAMGVRRCPTMLTAAPAENGVVLSWLNGADEATSVRILRNGEELAAAAPVDPPTFTDTELPPPGLFRYELTFAMSGDPCEPLTATFNGCITDLLATTSQDGVLLTWTNNMAYEGIRVERDGEVLEASLPGSETSYVDEEPPEAVIATYTVVPTNGECEPTTIRVNLGCYLPAPVCAPGQPAELVEAFAFGSRLLDCPTYNDPDVPYTIVWQGAPEDLLYTEERGWGYEAIFPELGGYAMFGPFDNSANNRNAFPDTCPEELYDSFIGAKNFSAFCNETTVGDPFEPCVAGGITPEGIVFRVDVPNGKYRFVAAVGSADNTHAHRLVAEDGGEGPPDEIGQNYVVLVDNFQQSQFAVGEVDLNNPGKGVFARVGFDEKIPPPGDPDHGFPSPQFVNMDEEGLPTADCASSPTLEVTEGYIRFHQLQGNANDGCGGTADPNGADLVILEIWRVEGGPPTTVNIHMGDTNGDTTVNLADAVRVLSYLFAGAAEPDCLKAADANDDNGINLADAVKILSYLFANQSLTAPDGTAITAGSHPGCSAYDSAEVEALGCKVPCAK